MKSALLDTCVFDSCSTGHVLDLKIQKLCGTALQNAKRMLILPQMEPLMNQTMSRNTGVAKWILCGEAPVLVVYIASIINKSV